MSDLPQAVWGVLDLRDLDFHRIETIPLSGEVEFYWHTLKAEGEPAYLWVPRGWSGELPLDSDYYKDGGGYGTYRFVVLLPSGLDEIGLYLPIQHSAYVLSINGREVARNGTVGTDPSTHRGEWKPNVARVPLRSTSLEFVLQISDFSMNTGGFFYPIRIGLPAVVESRFRMRSTAELIAFGILLFVSLYCFIMAVVQKGSDAILLLGIASLFFALRTITHGEMTHALFFSLDLEWINKVRYITLFVLPVVMGGFFYHGYQEWRDTRVNGTQSGNCSLTFEVIELRFLTLLGIILSSFLIPILLIILLRPAKEYVPLLSVVPAYLGIISLAVGYLLTRQIMAKNRQSVVLVGGFGFLILTVVRDLSFSTLRLWDNSFYSPFGYVFFILSLAVVLGREYTFLLEQQKSLARERQAQSEYLEVLVRERTRQLQEANTSLAQAVETATKANASKSAFLAMMSHEIRTPMNVVVGITELLEQTPLSSAQKEYVQTLRTAAEGLLVILNDVLDMSRLEAGRIQIESVETDLPQLLEEIRKFFQPTVEKKRIYLRCLMEQGCPPLVLTDPTRLRQVLINIIGNAIKFTTQGGVEVTVCALGASTGEGRGDTEEVITIQFVVSDTGIGIPKEKLGTIFQSFVQADTSITRKYGGTGLGLSISKRLVELMGGSLSVTSEKGKGSTFTFTIRAQIVKQTLKPLLDSLDGGVRGAPSQRGLSLRVLLVEDNEMNRMVVRSIMASLGWECVVASDGWEALEKLRSGGFDLVLMDVEMPEMDGLETTRRIRRGEAGSGNAQIPIVALSAHVLPEFRDNARRAGMDEYLTKPISRERLEQLALRFAYSCPRTLDDAREEARLLIEEYNGNREYVFALLRTFIDEITALLPQIEEALRRQDLRSVYEKGKALLNMALLLERRDLSLSISRMMERAAEGNAGECAEVFHQLSPLLLSYRERISLFLETVAEDASVTG